LSFYHIRFITFSAGLVAGLIIFSISAEQRKIPPVAGVDLEHALNYVPTQKAGIEFEYEYYTSGRVFYRAGKRPILLNIVSQILNPQDDELQQISILTRFANHKVMWASYYRKKTGQPLPSNRGFTDEQLINSEYGWCNEQARVLCALSQIAGFPARLVFLRRKDQAEHVIAEVLTSKGWLAVDPTFNLIFIKDGVPASAVDAFKNPANRRYFAKKYRDAYVKTCGLLGLKPPDEDTFLDYDVLGFFNYFSWETVNNSATSREKIK